MSVQSEDSRIQYSGDGITTVFPVPFYFFSEDDLKVVLKSESGTETYLERGLDFSVDGAGNEEGGEVVMAMSPGAGTEVTIYREIEVTQTTVYGENAEFPAKSHERALDKLTMICQQIARNLAATFRLRESDGDTTEAAKKINSVFGLDASGNPLFRTPSELVAWLNLTTPVLNFPTKTFTDAAERATAEPDFEGQVGSQQDDKSIWIAIGVSAGDWALFLNPPPNASVTTAKLAAALDFSGKTLTWGASQIPDSAIAALAWSKLTGIPTSSGDLTGVYPALFLRPGAVVQSVSATPYTANAALSVAIPLDDSVPQSGEGTQILSASITPTSASNKIMITVVLQAVYANGASCIAALFAGSGAGAIATTFRYSAASSYGGDMIIRFLHSPATTAPITYAVSAGAETGYTMYLNGFSTGRRLGGTCAATLTLQEIKE